MAERTDLSRLDGLMANLPFALDDGAAIASVLRRYRARGRERDHYFLELWTYCYVRRYFLIRFLRSRELRISELEAAIDYAYRSIGRGRSSLRDPGRYPNWVSVICRNTYVNLMTRRKDLVPVDRVAEPASKAGPPSENLDRIVLFQTLNASIDRLPEFLKAVARMRLIDQMEYSAISDRLGKPVPTVRSYMHKIAQRLRSDAQLAEVLGIAAGKAQGGVE